MSEKLHIIITGVSRGVIWALKHPARANPGKKRRGGKKKEEERKKEKEKEKEREKESQ